MDVKVGVIFFSCRFFGNRKFLGSILDPNPDYGVHFKRHGTRSIGTSMTVRFPDAIIYHI